MKTGKILMLEIVKDTTQLNKQRFRSWGHEVVQYVYHHNTYYHIIAEKPDMIIIQAQSSVFSDVFACCQALKSISRIQNIPMIVQLSQEDYQQNREFLYQEGIDDCIPSPVVYAELKTKVMTWLDKVQLKERLKQSHQALEESIQKINRQKSEIDHHLTLAARIQESLIPQNIIQVPNCSFYSHFQPSGKVGGDIYDIFMLDQEHVGLYMVDVMGHGVASSMIAVALSELMVPDVSRGTPLKKEIKYPPYYEIVTPGNVVQFLNKRFSFSKYQHYFTVFYMVLNTYTGLLRYCRGAHPEPLLLRKDGSLETLNAYGTPIGFEFSQEHEEETVQLKAGDRLLIYSDGLLELEDENHHIMDYDRMIQNVKNYQCSNTQRPLTMSFKKLADRQKELKDDLTLVEMLWEPLI